MARRLHHVHRQKNNEELVEHIDSGIEHVVKHMATKEDLEKLATKEQLAAVQRQVNSIERQLRETRTEIRLGDLEEKVFGKVRA